MSPALAKSVADLLSPQVTSTVMSVDRMVPRSDHEARQKLVEALSRSGYLETLFSAALQEGTSVTAWGVLSLVGRADHNSAKQEVGELGAPSGWHTGHGARGGRRRRWVGVQK